MPASVRQANQPDLMTFSRIVRQDPGGALRLAEAMAGDHPNHPGVMHAHGMALRMNRRHADAKKVLDALVGATPDFAGAWYERGLVNRALGHHNEALSDIERATVLKPDFAPAWRSLGDGYAALGEQEKADEAFRRYLALTNRHPLLLKALDAMQANRIPEAEQACREYLKQHPTDVTAIRLLADIGIKVEQFGDAEKLLERCLELAPDFTFARYNYAFVLSRQARFERAIEELDHLLATDGDNPNYRVLKASAHVRLGQFDEALEIYEGLLEGNPHQPKIYLSYGHALKTVGRQAESIAAYRTAIEQSPSLGEAYWSLANLKTVKLSNEEVAAMEAELAKPKLQADDASQLSFALGKALEDRGEHDRAFKHFSEGNAVRRRQIYYSAEENEQRARKTEALMDADFFKAREGWGVKDADPIFIVGLPRAGSTLLEQILASHSAVEGTQELPEMISIARRLGGKKKPTDPSQYPAVLGDMAADDFHALGQEYLDRTRRYRSDTPFFIDKMPNNFAYTGLIHLMMPNAKIIDARRHPMACCFSGFKQYFARGQRFTYDLGDIGNYYRNYVELMDHFDAVLPGRVHRVQYETLVDNFEAEVRRLLEYCGLPFEPGCLEFYKNERAVKTASSEQVRQPVYKDAVEHWRHFLPHLEPLMTALGPDVMERYPVS